MICNLHIDFDFVWRHRNYPSLLAQSRLTALRQAF
jgi:hypothetical protein